MSDSMSITRNQAQAGAVGMMPGSALDRLCGVSRCAFSCSVLSFYARLWRLHR
jgi:hypothetical protein